MVGWVRFFAFWTFGAIMLKRGGADFVVMLALIDSTWKFMLVWNGTALRSILLNEIYDLADIHFLQFIAYISASLSIRFQLETVKKSQKIRNFHFDLQLVPTVPNWQFLMVPFYTAKKLVVLPKRLKTTNV